MSPFNYSRVFKGSTCPYLAFFRLQATKALGKNAGVLGGSIMVGVAPCRDESVLDALNTRSGAVSEKSIPYTCWRVLQWSFLLSMAVGTPTLDTSVANLSSNLGGTPRSIRPLTQAYRSDSYYINQKFKEFTDEISSSGKLRARTRWFQARTRQLGALESWPRRWSTYLDGRENVNYFVLPNNQTWADIDVFFKET